MNLNCFTFPTGMEGWCVVMPMHGRRNKEYALQLPVEDCRCKPCNRERMKKVRQEERRQQRAAERQQQQSGPNWGQVAATTIGIATALGSPGLGAFPGGQHLDALDSKENYFLDLAAEEGWPKDKLRNKIAAIRTERKAITVRLDHADRQLEAGRDLLYQALDLLTDLQAMYHAGNEMVRSILNRAIFTKLYVDGRKVSEHELSEPFDVLHEAHQRHHIQQHGRPGNHTYHRHSGALVPTQRPASATNRSPLTEEGASGETLIDSLALALCGQGSSKAVMVEVLAAYSHSTQAADLRRCHTAALTNPVCAPKPEKDLYLLQD